jgi:hypothetical protein
MMAVYLKWDGDGRNPIPRQMRELARSPRWDIHHDGVPYEGRHWRNGTACQRGHCRHLVPYPDETGWGPSTRDRWPDAGPHGGWMLAKGHY